MFRFPYLDELAFSVWLTRIGNDKLKNLDARVVHRNYRVCENHFASVCINKLSKTPLKEGSLPTIGLPGFNEEPTPSNSFIHQYLEPMLKNVQLEVAEGHEEELIDKPHPETTPAPEPGCSQWTDPCLRSPTPSQPLHLQTCRTPKSRKDLQCRFSVLKSISTTRASFLTPKKQKLYRVVNNLKSISRKLMSDCEDYKTRLEKATDFYNTDTFIQSSVNKTTYQFIMSQLRLQKLKSKGRRFTDEEKILALTLSRSSSKNYKILQTIFALPSKETLKRLLRNIPIKCGINRLLFHSLKETLAKMASQDRTCCLSFDEVSLSTGLKYNIKDDYIEGFEDLGEGTRKLKFADHALVFMASGIRKKWKQPLAFYYVESGISTAELVRVMKEVISATQAAGLQVVATVCDQASKNKAAIKELCRQTQEGQLKKNQENRYFGFLINSQETIPLFDAPHMLKGIRNNLLKYDILFKWKSNSLQKASWKVFKAVYETDIPDDMDFRLFYSLTDAHIYEAKMNKMKVNLAAQIFSQRVASNIKYLTKAEPHILPAEAGGTAEFTLFMDKLFDSVNGCTIKPTHGKYLRSAIKEKSPHIAFWDEAIKVLETMIFIKSTGTHFVPPSVSSWIHTLKALKYLWQKLKNAGFNFLLPRNLNQDGLEIFFL